eukprot:2856129-Rhodomonas_salina.2
MQPRIGAYEPVDCGGVVPCSPSTSTHYLSTAQRTGSIPGHSTAQQRRTSIPQFSTRHRVGSRGCGTRSTWSRLTVVRAEAIASDLVAAYPISVLGIA